MKLVIDNNILFSLMKVDSSASIIFKRENMDLFAPAIIKTEFSRHRKLCLEKSGLSEKIFNKRLKIVESRILFIKLEEYKKFLKESIKIISDPSDSPYLSCAMRLQLPIWSNDKHLKEQSVVKVFSTFELILLLS